MEIEIIEERENPFFERKDYTFLLKHEGKPTPSKKELVEKLKEKLGVEEGQIEIDYIFTKKGKSESTAKVRIYSKPKIEVKKVEAQTSEGS
jgi:small subunit ribosomal protein S24e